MNLDNYDQYRIERIERLLKELTYEIGMGIAQRQIPTTMILNNCYPCMDNDCNRIIMLSFELRPVLRYDFPGYGLDKMNKLIVIPGDKK